MFYVTSCEITVYSLIITDCQAELNYWSQWRIQDFPEEGAPTPQGAPTYEFAKFSQKLHEIERIWTRGGRVSLAPP